MPVKRLSHVSLSSRDLAATERFYVDILGFKIAHEFHNAAGERYGFFLHAGGGSFLECFQVKDAAESRMLRAVRPYRGRILKTLLPREAEQRLKAGVNRAA